MKTFYVLLLRSTKLLGSDDFSSAQDLQYIAGPIEAADENDAAAKALTELKRADKKDLNKESYALRSETLVLGMIEDGIYWPWLNGDFR